MRVERESRTGKNAKSDWTITPARAILNDNNFLFPDVTGAAAWLNVDATLIATQGIVRVTVDLTKSAIKDEFTSAEAFKSVCQPVTYCAVNGTGATQTCGCKADANCKDDDVCTWGTKDPDCPENGCYAFSFTMPSNFLASNTPVPAPAPVPFTNDTYFQSEKVQFMNAAAPGPQCTYSAVPTQP